MSKTHIPKFRAFQIANIPQFAHKARFVIIKGKLAN